MSKVITVTLNPTLDRTLIVHYLAMGYSNTVTEPTRMDPAGRGVNVSRALSKLGKNTHALVMIGTDAIGRAYMALMEEEPFSVSLIQREGLTRSNTIILDSGNKNETHLIEEADIHTDDEDDINVISTRLREILEPEDTVALSGVLPGGVPTNIYAHLTDLAHEVGAQVVLAADGIALEVGMRVQPDIIVLRHNELEAFFNYPVRTPEDVIYAARKISQRSNGCTVMVSQQSVQYGVLVNENDGWIARLPESDQEYEGTTSGVHDAALAGFLAGFSRQMNSELPDALKIGMAAAAYSRAQVGNEFGTMDDIQPYLDQITVEGLTQASAGD